MKYLVDRVIRIWPPLLFSLALIVCLYKLAPLFFPSGTSAFLPASGHTLARTAFISDPAQLYGAALMLNGFVTDTPNANGPLWSLSIEVWYYFLAAILALPRGWWKVLVLPFAGAVIWLGMNNEPFLYYLPVWWAGYLLAVLHDRLLSFSLNLLRGAAAVCFLIALLLGVRFVSASYAHDPVADSLSLIASFNMAAGMGFCFILALVLQGRISIPTFARAAARYSYTLYIVHAPIFLFLFGFFQPYIQNSLGASVMVSLLAIVGVALLSAIVSTAVENRRLILSLFAPRRKPQPLR